MFFAPFLETLLVAVFGFDPISGPSFAFVDPSSLSSTIRISFDERDGLEDKEEDEDGGFRCVLGFGCGFSTAETERDGRDEIESISDGKEGEEDREFVFDCCCCFDDFCLESFSFLAFGFEVDAED